MAQVPNKITAVNFMRQSLYGTDAVQKSGDAYVPARPLFYGANWIDALKIRFRLSWCVFTGQADAFFYEPPCETESTQ